MALEWLERLDVQMGAAVVGAVYLSTLVLHLVVPGSRVAGYAMDRNGKPLQYKLNGFRVLVIQVVLWGLLGWTGAVPAWTIAVNFENSALAANAIGLLFAVAFFLRGWSKPLEDQEEYLQTTTADKPGKPTASAADKEMFRKRHVLGHFFLGYEFNPRYGLFDVKMFLYLVGAVMLELNVLSAAALQYKLDRDRISMAMLAYALCMSWFVGEYMLGEYVHTFTYDIFAERVGFKLLWGCLTFYPFFYALPASAVVKHGVGQDLTARGFVFVVVLYLAGWVLTRGANMQKFWFKRDPRAKTCFAGLINQETVPGSRILCSGFWGLSRHVNYLGEIIQALAVSLPGYFVSGSLIPFAYPVYYILLFVQRQIDDDALCAAKYGAKWDEYVRRVPARIVPYLY